MLIGIAAAPARLPRLSRPPASRPKRKTAVKLLAFAASGSAQSINKQLVRHAISLLPDGIAGEVIDIRDYELPIYSADREAELGQPAAAQAFLQKIQGSDAVLISFAEHNGSYTAAYKNLFDWCSRIDAKVYRGKAMLLLAASPGPRGGGNVLAAATASMPHFGGEVKGSFSLPNFHDNFDAASGGITSPDLAAQLRQTLQALAP